MPASVELVNLYRKLLEDVSSGNRAGMIALLADDPGWVVDRSHFSMNGLEVADRMTLEYGMIASVP